MGSISIREHIHWLPNAPDEPTSTLVLTSPGRRFVDVRILKPFKKNDSSGETLDALPLDRLDWAFAGFSSSSQRDDGNGRMISHSRWQHWVDSRSPNAEEVVDEGDMFPQPDGKALETGRMVNPGTGQETDYEELWLDEEPVSTTEPGEPAPCRVLQLQDDGHKVRGMIVHLGQYCQGVLRRGPDITVERWQWTSDSTPKWKRTARLGDGYLPCRALLDIEFGQGENGQIVHGEDIWRIVELAG